MSIKYLTLALKEFFRDKIKETNIVFSPPTDNAIREQNTISIFLYDIRENLELRSNDTVKNFRNGKYEITYPPKYVDCSYLITAWSKQQDELGCLEEQQLLSQVFQVLSVISYIPDKYLHEVLKIQKQKIPITISHLDNLKNIGEFWSAIGGKLRPSISVTLTISLETVPDPIEAHEVTSSEVNLFQLSEYNQKDTWFSIGGQITNNSEPPQPLADATVSLVELGYHTKTNAQGRYILSNVPIGTYTLKAELASVSEQKPIYLNRDDTESQNKQRDFNLRLNVIQNSPLIN